MAILTMYRSAIESNLNDQDELFKEAERSTSKDSFLLSALGKSLTPGLRNKDQVWAAVNEKIARVQGLLDAADPAQQAQDKKRRMGF
ncbi:hypothetical protein CC99x_008510 [Candidatus Berkiella cookevillensis]|uniref:Uncharacterized protein n=1 Tax=Candidatus Berkiella cookevillensis TaxID=437022 RepID=A0A0Q9YFH5_9GAMM|nr:hypothetical protein [Candidatus Berkiella cookevillensis]MCS5708941.1 hypothetical protein [Candidatus Berkiella cookevillensis]